MHVIGMAGALLTKSREKPVGRVGIPAKGFDAEGRQDNTCPQDQPDLHGLFCRKTVKIDILPQFCFACPHKSD
jgi:hypothetical protein